MTSVLFDELNSGMLFECSGHAGAGRKGSDIVCAGVSALVIALIERLDELQDEQLVKIESFHTADGEVALEASWEDSFGRTAAMGVFETVRTGLRRISEMYPDNVCVNN